MGRWWRLAEFDELGRAMTAMECHPFAGQPRPVVAIVDDEPQIRSYMTAALAPLGVEIAEFGSCTEFVAALDRRHFDCALVDLRLPDGTGLDLAASVKSRDLSTALVLVTGFANVRVAVQAVQDGMIDVLEKPFSAVDAQAAVNRGIRICREREAKARQMHQVRGRVASLSDSERAVLDLVLGGLPNKVIARSLNMGLRTVESRKAQLYLKLGAGSISELVQIAMTAGITREMPVQAAG